MTAQKPAVDVALPPGAVTSDEWEFWDHEYRVVSTEDYAVATWNGSTMKVYVSGIQLPDGTVDDGSRADDGEQPKVWIEAAYGMTSAQARELAELLGKLADVADQWVGAR